MNKNYIFNNIYNNIKLENGNFEDEIDLHYIIIKFLSGYEKVLEIGGNIGKTSLIIAYLLNKKNNNNFLSLEMNLFYANQLINNIKYVLIH